jgi:integrase
MATMPRPRPPHLHRQTSRHGATVWYVRKGHGPRVRIRAAFGTPEFDVEYQAAMMDAVRSKPTTSTAAAGSLVWLIERYRESLAWAALSVATKRQRENIFKHVIASAGTTLFTRITQATIVAGRERRKETPAQARNFLDAMRGVFKWAMEAKHCTVDPTVGVKNPRRPRGPGFKMWTEDEMAAYEHRWPIGTRQRVWLDVLAYTGLRRGDAVRLGRQHVRNGVASLKVEKGGYAITVTLPILPILAATLAAGPVGELAFIVGEKGKPLTKESFGNEFRQACKAAAVPGSAHGVRKIAATRAALNGATTAQLRALFGWTSDAMPSLYTKDADRVRLARESAHTLVPNDQRTSIPSPDHPVREPEQKAE